MFTRCFVVLAVLAMLVSVGQAQAQQNSTVFPWNGGYGGGTTPRFVSQPISLPQPQVPAVTRTDDGEAQEDVGHHAFIELRVPANAEIWFEGTKTLQSGNVREFVSPPIETARHFVYDVRARWTDADGKVVDQTRKVKVEAGRRTTVDFSAPAQPKP